MPKHASSRRVWAESSTFALDEPVVVAVFSGMSPRATYYAYFFSYGYPSMGRGWRTRD